MAIPKNIDAQRDFSAGQIDSYGERRDDTKIHSAALRRARNIRPLETGSASRRAGRRIRYFDDGRSDTVRPVTGVEFSVTFGAGRFTARLPSGGIAVNITGAPWTLAMLPDLSIWAVGLRIFVAHREMRTQVLDYDVAAGTWTRTAFAFRIGPSGEVRAPFYRFGATKSVTMQPSALTGDIAIVFTADVLVPQHDGLLFRYVGRQLRITEVIDARNANATVIQELPPSKSVNVVNTTGYSVGEVVEGDTTSARGEIVRVVDANTMEVVLMTNFIGFEDDEYLIGPNARARITSTPSTIAPQPSVQWDEQFISDYRGWPGSVSADRQRVIFADFDQFPQAIVWGAINADDDMKVTAAADGAIFDYVPYPGRVLYVSGGTDEFVFTDQGVYFIPISPSSPLAPGSIEFRRISSEGAARIRPVDTSGGAIFVSANRKRIYAIVGTGQQTRPWIARPLSDLHSQLFNEPVAIAAVASLGEKPGQHVYVANADGSLVVGRYDDEAEWMGWFPWDGEGGVTDIAGRFDTLTVMCAYDLDGSTINTVEDFDDDLVMDGVIDLSDVDGTNTLRWSDGTPIELSTGDDLTLSAGALSDFAGKTVHAMSGDFYLGEIEVDENGRPLVEEGDFDDLKVGFPFTLEVEPFLENFDGGQDVGQRMRRRKVAKVVMTYRDTQLFNADGRRFAGPRVGDQQEAERVRWSDTKSWRQTGRSFDPRVLISQPIPGTFNLIELTCEVTT